METINGIIEQVKLRNDNGFIIFSLRSGRNVFIVTGEDQDLHEADVVECEGTWSTYRNAPQFKAKRILPQIPSTSDAIVAYLASGRIKGISKVFASRLVDHFGDELLEIIETNPERLREVSGFGKARIKMLTEGLREQIGYRSILLFLHGFGLSNNVIKKIFKVYGHEAVSKLTTSPYKLCDEIDGIGFKIADRIAMQSGRQADDKDRIRSGLQYVLRNLVERTGSTCVSSEDLCAETLKVLTEAGPVSPDQAMAELKEIVSEGLVYEIQLDTDLLICPGYLYEAELGIAKNIHRLLSTGTVTGEGVKLLDELIDLAEKSIGIVLSDKQRNAVRNGLIHPVSIITGGPGTGKTTIIKALLECCRLALDYTPSDIQLCAPTGKAAKRLSESTGLDAMTIHRALEYQPMDECFAFNEENPLPVRLVTADEFSMADAQLAFWLTQAIANGTRLVLVGDFDQLDSVGPGKVLKDLIDSQVVPVTRLIEIRRQAANSKITSNAHLINKGEAPQTTNLGKESDFWFIKGSTPDEIASTLTGLVDRVSKFYGYDPYDDIVILTPVLKGPLGVYALNELLQAKLNRNKGNGINKKQDGQDVEFCLSDKVIHVKNNKSLNVFNGETGRVIRLDRSKKVLTVQYDDKQVEYGFAELDELRLAYALTIHKSQGSEYPCVLMPASPSHYNMLYRALYYTGFTRAKKTLVAVGEVRALSIAAKNNHSDKRTTGLLHHLKALS